MSEQTKTAEVDVRPLWDVAGMTWNRVIPSVKGTLREAGMHEQAKEWEQKAVAMYFRTGPMPTTRTDFEKEQSDRNVAVLALAYDYVKVLDGPSHVKGLQEYREQRGLSRQSLAKKAGVASSTIARIEKGAPAKVRTLQALARALEIAPTQLLWY